METSTQTTIPGTATPTPTRKTSTVLWMAFVLREGTATVLTGKTQRELKKGLNLLGENTQVLTIVRGKPFSTKVTQSFDIVEATLQ